MQKASQLHRSRRAKIGLVPTMGALHEGHLSLIRKARAENDIVIVSIFVNPAQFGPNEDYLKYPRPFFKDKSLCAAAGVDYLFSPKPGDMYPSGYRTYISVEKLSDVLCGAFRPGHFKGVATIVAKLFNIALPDSAYFGRKDFQQLAILKKMASDLNFPVRIAPCETVREKGGLALSSRNIFLSNAERLEAVKISAALLKARKSVQDKKIRSASAVRAVVVKVLNSIPGAKIEYVEVRGSRDLEEIKRVKAPAVIAVAVRVGATRLIDNIEI